MENAENTQKIETDPRMKARENARAIVRELAPSTGLDLLCFSLLSHSASMGSVLATIPHSTKEVGIEPTLLKKAIDALFDDELAAWNTSKGWIYSRHARNPETKRPLTGELRMTEKALREHGNDIYKVYFMANDFEGNDIPRRQWKALPEWRAALVPLVAPAASVAPALTTRANRRMR